MKEAKGAKMFFYFSLFFWLSLCSLLLPIHRQNTQIQFDDLFPAGWLHIKRRRRREVKKDDNKFLLRMRFVSFTLFPLSPPPIMRFHFHKKTVQVISKSLRLLSNVWFFIYLGKKLLSILENIREWRHKRR